MKHEQYPAVLILSITLVLFFFVIGAYSLDLSERNIGGMAIENPSTPICHFEDYCLDWEMHDIVRYNCAEPVFRSSKFCIAYDYKMDCVEWDYNVIQDCNQLASEVFWEKDCLAWEKREVCE